MKLDGEAFRDGSKLLRRGLFVAGAAAVAGAFKAALERDWRGAVSGEEKIASFRKGPSGFDSDRNFFDNAGKPTKGAEMFTRAEFAQRTFADASAIVMPKSIQKKLAAIAPGIPGQETRYDNNRSSAANARFIWQFTEPMVDDLNKISGAHVKLEDARSLAVATPLAFEYFDRVIYSKVCDPALRVCQAFGLGSDEAAEQFTVLCMVNAYNAGPTRIANMLDAFAMSESPSGAHALYDYTPLSLFNVFTEAANRPKGNLSRGYGREASDYVFKVLAAAESLNAHYALVYKKTLAERVWDTARHTYDVALAEAVEPALLGLGGGALGAFADAAVQAKLGLSAGTLRLPSRREVFAGSAVAAGAAAVGIVSHAGLRHQFGNFELPNISGKLWWHQPEEEVPVRFPDGTIYLPGAARKELSQFGGMRKLFVRPPSAFALNTLPESNFTKAGVVAALQRLEKKGALKRITAEDIEHDTAAYRSLSYSVEPVGTAWRCRGVGEGARQSDTNDPRYLKLTSGAGAALEHIAKTFQGMLTDAGLSSEWKIRPIINGVLRSDGKDGTNSHVHGASDYSPHLFGVGFDLSLSKFDVIHVPTGDFFTTAPGESLTQQLDGILARILKQMHDRKELVLTYEPKADHFHVSVVFPRSEDMPKTRPKSKPIHTHHPSEKKVRDPSKEHPVKKSRPVHRRGKH